MKVLIACEFSGVVREAFAEMGHDAWSCDLLESEKPGKHIVSDVRDVLSDSWDLLIAHPPCTRLANSGVRWLHVPPSGRTVDEMWAEMEVAVAFFVVLLNARIPRRAIENPIPHKYAMNLIGRRYDQIIQPYQFGHGETKSTCLWLENLPKLQPTEIVEGRKARVHRLPPSANRWKERSRTVAGIAAAMAQQWGS